MENQKKKFQCEKCHGFFSRSDSLSKHLRGHCKGAPLQTICQICGKDFLTTWRLKRHNKSKHEQVQPEQEPESITVKSASVGLASSVDVVSFSDDEEDNPALDPSILQKVLEVIPCVDNMGDVETKLLTKTVSQL